MSVTTHVDIPQTHLPDLSTIQGLEYIGGTVDYAFDDDRALVAFDQYDEGVWTAAIWPRSGDGKAEALALAERFRDNGVYAWAYSQDADRPYDLAFGPRNPARDASPAL